MKVLTEKNIETLDGKSMDVVADNIEKLRSIFPEVFCEDKIDFEKLQEVLGNYIEDKEERYRFEWNGKSQAIRIAQTPSTGTLRPCKEESKNWDTTQNLYIEGDNLEVLKLLQKSYQNKVKMIYIDPPYNTGTDIIYKNDYSDSIQYYKKFTGQITDDNFKKTTNSETNGRYHSNWLNMMYSVIRLGRNLLSEDGLIVIAIDDYEQSRLKLICDEIMGESNFVGTVVSRCNPQGRGKKNLDPVHEYHLLYAKSLELLPEIQIKKRSTQKTYKNLMRSGTNSRKNERPYRFYPILLKNGEISMITMEEYNKIYCKENGFNEQFIEELKEKYVKLGYKVIFPIAGNGEEKVWQRTFERVLGEYKTYIYQSGQIKTPDLEYRTPVSLWIDDIHSNVSNGTNMLINIFGGKKIFDYPKSIFTVKDFISLAPKGIVLDFFSGSCTTAHAVMKLNSEDNGDRKFIMVQLPEKLDERSEAYKNNYDTLCDIGKARIKLSGDRILSENKGKDGIENLDIGFKVLKLDSSNIKKWNPDYDNLEQSFDDMLDNFVPNRTDEDVVYEIMLKYGIDLTYPVEEKIINGKKIYSVGFGALIICLDNDITLDVIEGIVELKKELSPEVCRIVFKDNGFTNDSVKTNAIQILRRNNIKEIMSI